jgi:hypothetical protein
MIQSIYVALRNIFNAIANPSWVDKSANNVRTAILSGTVTTVTTVTTVSTVSDITSLGGLPARATMFQLGNLAWAQTVRPRIS